MHFDVIRKTEELDALAGEWDALLQDSATHVPFLRHAFLSTWWKTLGGGEWQEAELCVVTARRENGELAGIAPLFFTKNRQGEPALMFLGSIEIADFLDVIVRPEDTREFMAELLDFLTKVESPDWRVLDLYNVLDSSPTLPALQSAAEVRGCQVSQEPLQHCPYIPLPEDWDTYLSGVDKKQRHEIRRKMRRAGDHVVPLRWYIVEDENRLDGEIDAFFNLMAQDPKKDKFLTEAMRRQMRETTHIAFREGWLQFAFLDVGKEKAAAYLNFDYLDRIWVYNSGIDSRFRELSLGWVLLGYLIQWAIEHKRKAYDFMRGDEDYKYRFGGVDRRVIRMQVRR